MDRKVVVSLTIFMVLLLSTSMLLYFFFSGSNASDEQLSNIPIESAPSLPGHDALKHFAESGNVPHSQGYPKAGETDIRLPSSVKPISYTVYLMPMMNGNFTVFGSVDIELDVLEATSNVTLHIKDIITKNETIKLNPMDDLTGPGITISEHQYDQPRDFYVAQLAEQLQAGQQYLLHIEFEGYLNDQLHGYYRSHYTNANGTETWLAVSDFEPTNARRAFPCFDEPAMKATFEFHIARQTNMTAISNMPLLDTQPFENDDTWVWDRFNRTLPMSTYLMAFPVMDFAFLSSNYNDHVLFRVWCRPEAINQAEYARDAGPFVLTWYEDYFSILFPLPKQDMIAIPDFSSGAMENWGLITYRETALLYDPIYGSEKNKERVARVVAHELAHQWFGDLVTMKWWTDLWLNEGFASYMEYLGTDAFEPSWDIKSLLLIDDLQYVFTEDSLESSHPISVEVSNPDEINEIFDSISYSKGASIIRMMNFFLSENTFRAGLTNYLNKFQYSNAAQDDLWESLTEQAHTDGSLPADLTVKDIMDTWTLQMGYPVIGVSLNGDGTATLTQKRFLMVENPNSNDTHVYRWWVPLTFASSDNPDFSQTKANTWMSVDDESLVVTGVPAESDKWVIFNVQQTGYYRVNYEPAMWQLIIGQLQEGHAVIDTLNRAQLIDDALDLARAGQLSYDIALSINAYLGNETEYIPWQSSMDNLDYLESMFTRSSGYGALKDYLLSLLTPLYDSVGFDDNRNDPHLTQYKRVLADSWTCHLGMPDCVQNSVDLYSGWMANPTNLSIVSPNLKSTVYCTGIAEGGEEEWNFGWNQYLETNLGSEKDTLLSALGCSREIWILSRYLEMAFTEGSGIRKQDAQRVFSSVANNDVGRDLAWDYLRDNFDAINSYNTANTVIGDLVTAATYEFNTNEELNELLQFKADHEQELGTATRAIDQSIERCTNNIAWMDNYYTVILQWLNDNGYGNPQPN